MSASDVIAMPDDPFGLRSLDIERLRAKRCAKWAEVPDGTQYAAWVADMDFPVAPAIRAALRDVIDRDEFGYPDWGGPYALSPAAKLFPHRMRERYGWSPDPDHLYDLVDVLAYPRHSMRLTELVTPLKPLEAMAQGVPVVTSEGTATEETAGSAAVLVKPMDPTDIARGITEAIARRAELSAKGFARAKKRSWRETAALTAQVYRELA